MGLTAVTASVWAQIRLLQNIDMKFRKSELGGAIVQTLALLVVICGVEVAISSYFNFEDYNTYASTTNGIIKELRLALDAYHLNTSNQNNLVSDTECEEMDVSLASLVNEGYITSELIESDPVASYEVSFENTSYDRVGIQVITVTFDSTQVATYLAQHLEPTYQQGNVLVFKRGMLAKENMSFIGILLRDEDTGCWQES